MIAYDPIAILANEPKVLINQKVELFEVITGIETNNRYAICDSFGRPFLKAAESTNCFARIGCKKNRPFIIHIVDYSGRHLSTIQREYRIDFCQACSCSECCRDRINVEFFNGNYIGSIVQEPGCCTIAFTIRDAADQAVMFIQGPPYCMCRCPGGKHTFQALTPDKSIAIGHVKKVWSGLVRELLTDADNFEVEFAQGMPVEHRVLLIGAAFLIDFMFFEDDPGLRHFA